MDTKPDARFPAQAGALLLDWLLPTVCVCCEQVPGAAPAGARRPPRGWCEGCASSLPGRHARRCPMCGEREPAAAPGEHPFMPAAWPGASAPPTGGAPRAGTWRSQPGAPVPCPRCRGQRPAFDRSIVLADYAPPLDRLVQAIKFGRQSGLAAPLGRLLAQAVAGVLADEPALRPGLVTAIPLAPARLAARGFNQAGLLAAPVARAVGVAAAARMLERVRQGAPASSLGAHGRRRALERAFVAPPLTGAPTVLVVDDVMTTGATLDAAARALKAAGAGAVIACVAARTPSPATGAR